MTVPVAGCCGLALSSRISAWSATISSRCSTPTPVFALTSQKIVSPPHSSGWRPSSTSSRLTRSGSAPGLSILLIATMIGTFALRAWATASLVWGITPSSAATTRMTTSVTDAPRARICVNAS